MDRSRKRVALLAGCQALLLANNSVLISVNGLAGYALASNKALATLPVTAYFVGSAMSALPFSLLMKRYGRRAGFAAGAVCAMVGALLCALAVYTRTFWLLCLGTLVLGGYFAAGQFYRFAAAEAVPAQFKATAISLVLAGGIIGGFLGPETAKFTRDLIEGLVTRFIESQVYQSVIENHACEQAAKMIAMKNATENAEQMIDDLTLLYNNVRQAAITQEISEIVGGAAAV